MCGIAGIYHFDQLHSVESDAIIKMTDRIKHRGPDGTGYFIENNIAFGHVRLSIIDLEKGNQPFLDDNGNLVLIYNGEIYNYKELREELKKLGHNFNTNSDTEVVLKAYKQWGKSCLNKFNGMWAFAIWDKEKKEIFLSRDRMGIKPLYYYFDKDKFIFASELKAFYDQIHISFNNNELWDLLVFGPKAGGKTHLQNINELEPGSFIFIKGRDFNKESFYSLIDTFENSSRKYDEKEISFLIEDAIKIRLVADVSIGTLNSGGLDSSLISAIAIKQNGNKLNTFSVAPQRSNDSIMPGDESFFAECLAGHIKSNHNTIRYSSDDFFNELKNTIYYNDFILYHSNTIPSTIMYEKIKKDFHTTVLLSGEGADEVFRGYSINRLINIRKKYGNIALLDKLYVNKYIKACTKYVESNDVNLQLIISKDSFLEPTTVDNLLGIKGNISEDRVNLLEQTKSLSSLNRAIYYEQKCYLSGLLQRVDRTSMKGGTEVRIPFLDYRLISALNSIDFGKKSGITHASVKKILKKIAIAKIPNEIIKRKKEGFASPLNFYRNRIQNELKSIKIIKVEHELLKVSDQFLILNYFKLQEILNNPNRL